MSNSRAPLLVTPQQVKEIMPDNVGYRRPNRSWGMKMLFAPFDQTSPGDFFRVWFFRVLIALVLVAFGVFVNAWTVITFWSQSNIMVLAAATSVGGPAFAMLRNFFVAIIIGAVYYVTTLWTHDTELPVFVWPEFAFMSPLTGNIGLIPAWIGAGVCIAFYVAFGAGLTNLTLQSPIVNTATSSQQLALLFVGGFVICTSWLYNVCFSSSARDQKHKHWRVAKATAIAMIISGVAFVPLTVGTNPPTSPTPVMPYFSAGLYLAAYMAEPTPALIANPAAFTCIPLFASTGGAIVLCLIVYLLLWGGDRLKENASSSKAADYEEAPSEPQTDDMRAPIRVGSAVKRHINVNF